MDCMNWVGLAIGSNTVSMSMVRRPQSLNTCDIIDAKVAGDIRPSASRIFVSSVRKTLSTLRAYAICDSRKYKPDARMPIREGTVVNGMMRPEPGDLDNGMNFETLARPL